MRKLRNVLSTILVLAVMFSTVGSSAIMAHYPYETKGVIYGENDDFELIIQKIEREMASHAFETREDEIAKLTYLAEKYLSPLEEVSQEFHRINSFRLNDRAIFFFGKPANFTPPLTCFTSFHSGGITFQGYLVRDSFSFFNTSVHGLFDFVALYSGILFASPVFPIPRSLEAPQYFSEEITFSSGLTGGPLSEKEIEIKYSLLEVERNNVEFMLAEDSVILENIKRSRQKSIDGFEESIESLSFMPTSSAFIERHFVVHYNVPNDFRPPLLINYSRTINGVLHTGYLYLSSFTALQITSTTMHAGASYSGWIFAGQEPIPWYHFELD